MARWTVAVYFVVIVLMCYLSSPPQGALAASEAQLKFVPVPAASSGSDEKKSRTPRDSSGPLVTKSRPSNTSIDAVTRQPNVVTIRRQLIGPAEHDTGRLEAAATYHHQQLQRGVIRGQGSSYHGEDHSRNYRGSNRGYNSAYGGLQGSPEHFGPPHGEHYPSNRHHGDQRFSGHHGGQNSRLQHVPLRENRVEVRIDDYRRDQGALNHAVSIQHQQQHQHHQQQGPHHQQRQIARDRGDSWQNRPRQGFSGSNDLLPNQNRPFDGGITGESSESGSGGATSCGPRSPCLEPNGLFPVDGNCCSFVSCANCRPYTQRCAAGTVFDLDLWTCNHERDVQQCAGNNRDCAHAEVNLRGDYGDSTDGGQGGYGAPQGYTNSDGGSYNGPSQYGSSHHGSSQYGSSHHGSSQYGPSHHGSSQYGPSHHGSSQYGQSHHGQSYQTRHHSSQYNSGDYGGSSQGHRGSGWEYAAASEPKASRKSGKVPRVNKGVIASSKKKKAAAASAAAAAAAA